MFRGSRRRYFAYIGLIILLVLDAGYIGYLLGSAKHSQESAQRSKAVEAKAKRQSEHQQAIPKTPWPAFIDKAEKAAEADCSSPQECRAEQREYSDLKAQWEAADAARGAERAGWWQTWIASFGVLLLLATLWVTIHTSRRQLRAYITLDSTKVAIREGREPAITVFFKNSGNTPAFNVIASSVTEMMIADRRVEFPPQPIGISSGREVGPNVEFELTGYGDAPLTADQIERMKAGEIAVYMHGHVHYVTFGKRRITRFSIQSRYYDDDWRTRPSRYGNDAT